MLFQFQLLNNNKINKEGNWMRRLDLRHLPLGLLCSMRLGLVAGIAPQTGS